MTVSGKSAADNQLGSYLSEWTQRELQLARLHEEIVSKRESLLSCSASYHQSQEQRQKQGTFTSDEAYLRNHKLLQDIRSAQEKLFDALSASPTPRFMTLQKNYWAMVRSQVPMWEQDLGLQRTKFATGRARSPGRRSQSHGHAKSRTSKKHRKSQQQK